MAKYLCLLTVCLCIGNVVSQFGFYQNGRETAERRLPFSFNQNILSVPKRVTEKLTGILHLRPEKEITKSEYIYPFDRPNENEPNNYPNKYQNNAYNIEIVKVPGITLNEYNNNNNPVQEGNTGPKGNYNGNNENNENDPNKGVFDEYRPLAIPNFFPIVSNDNKQSIPTINPNEEPIEVIILDTKPVTFAPENTNIQKPGIPNFPPPSVNNPDEIPYDNVNFENDKRPGVPTLKPQENNSQDVPTFKPQQSDYHGIPNVPPVSLPGYTTKATLLPPLTPVPASGVRNNFNFGTHGLFSESCTTVDGGDGSCISVYRCEVFVKMLKQATSSNPAVVQLLRKAHCGFEGNSPKVCCPKAGIPTGIPTLPTTTTTSTTEEPKSGKSEDLLSAFPEPPVCGFSNATLSRVVGGIPAKLGDFPWMALLGYKGKRNPATRWLCGGSLISSKHILTAAHCIHGHEDDLYLIRLGELDLARDDDGATPIDILIKTKIKHEEYNPKAFTNDIGILVLEREVEFTDLIRPVCIPKDSELRARSFENYNPIIAGWGDTEFRGPSATHLQVLQLPVVSNEFCAKAYSQYKAQTIDERVLCAGYKNGGKDACQGDSGGPLLQPIWNSVTYQTFFYQIGVVSYGKKCAEAGFPGVYTRVTHFVPWLEEQLIGSL